MHTNIALNFDNRFYQHLPFSYQQVKTQPLQQSFIVCHSQSAAKLLDLPEQYWLNPDFLNIFSGKEIPDNGHCIAQVYAGHQFGHYVPQLGDGRSIFIGQVHNQKNQHIDIHLKGAGQTPYSRMGDGRAVLRSAIREFLASEAMAALNIPTTRALCIVGSTEAVYRETCETGAVMTRLAQSHIRFGNFEYWFHQNKQDELNQLADFCLAEYFPQCLSTPKPHLAMLNEIVKRTATLIASWQVHGFAHGVMNTDNMSIIGLTLDYGPFGFLDDYQPNFICNHSDHQGRYAFDQQPGIGLWNLNALAITFSNWLSDEEITTALQQYEPILVKHYLGLMQQKLGLANWQESDHSLLGEFLSLMANQKADYSLSFRLLNMVTLNDPNNKQCQTLLDLFNDQTPIVNWLIRYRQRLADNRYSQEERIKKQDNINALYLLRNYLAENAIKLAEQGDYSEIEKLLNLLSKPFTEQTDQQRYAKPAPSWGKCLEISCSS